MRAQPRTSTPVPSPPPCGLAVVLAAARAVGAVHGGAQLAGVHVTVAAPTVPVLPPPPTNPQPPPPPRPPRNCCRPAGYCARHGWACALPGQPRQRLRDWRGDSGGWWRRGAPHAGVPGVGGCLPVSSNMAASPAFRACYCQCLHSLHSIMHAGGPPSLPQPCRPPRIRMPTRRDGGPPSCAYGPSLPPRKLTKQATKEP